MQEFVTIRTVPKPFALDGGGTATARVRLTAAAVSVWSDGTIDPAWKAGTTALSAYGGSAVDTTMLVWVVLAIKGNLIPYLVKEADVFASAVDAVLTGAGLTGAIWALLARVDGPTVDRMAQA